MRRGRSLAPRTIKAFSLFGTLSAGACAQPAERDLLRDEFGLRMCSVGKLSRLDPGALPAGVDSIVKLRLDDPGGKCIAAMDRQMTSVGFACEEHGGETHCGKVFDNGSVAEAEFALGHVVFTRQDHR